MIRWMYAFLDRPRDVHEQSTAFWSTVTGTRLSPPRGEHGEFATLLPGGADPHLKVQAVGTGPDIHLDLCSEDTTALARAAQDLGAGLVTDHGSWSVLRSPAGLPFCSVEWRGESRRQAPYPPGDGVLPDTVCIDVSADVYEAEVAFWTALTGWSHRSVAREDFHAVEPPAPLPLRLLIQQLGTPRPAGAHLDLACPDSERFAAEHVKLGAEVVDRLRYWTIMRDPGGGVYCLVQRPPAGG
jgi:hypothetical protein